MILHKDIDTHPLWTDGRAWALLFAASLTTMANATISPALTGLEALYSDHPYAELLIRMLVPAPSLSIIFFASLSGVMADRFGRRVILLIGLILFVLSGPAGYFLDDLSAIFASRLILGVSVALIMTTQTALIGDYYVGAQRAALNGLQISARNFGGLVFITLAGWLATMSPHLPFLIYGLAAFLMPLAFVTLHDKPHDHQDRVNNTAPLSPSQTTDQKDWFGLVMGLALLQGITSLSFFLMPTQLPFFLQERGYDSASTTGILLGVLTLCGGVSALQYGWIKQHLSFAAIYACGYLLMAMGMGLLIFDSDIWIIAAGAAGIGFGFALVMPNFVTLMLQLAPASHRGRASGILSTSIFLGQLVSPLVSIPAINVIGFEGTFALFGLVLAIVASTAFVQSLRLRLA